MKNYKQLFCGILIGVITTISITVLAEYIVNPNPYPIKVNGSNAIIEGYTINDSTYFKLRDIADAVGGLSIDFADNTITINTVAQSESDIDNNTTSTSTTNSVIKPTPNPKLGQDSINYLSTVRGQEYTTDGIPLTIWNSSSENPCVWDDGSKYVDVSYIEKVYNIEENGYVFGTNYIRDEQRNKVVENIIVSEDYNIELNYYETVLKPWLQQYCK